MIARFPVVSVLDLSRVQDGTVTIDRTAGLFGVRPKRGRRVYTLPLATVASIVVSRVIKAEVAEQRRTKAPRGGRS